MSRFGAHGFSESYYCPTLPVQSADGEPFHNQLHLTEEIDVSSILDKYQFGFMDFLTPLLMPPPLFTPDAPRPWQSHSEQPRHSTAEMGLHSIDLNADLMAEVTPELPPPTGQNDEPRRNPPRATRNQRRWCGT